jgi:glutamate--cysteine ligase
MLDSAYGGQRYAQTLAQLLQRVDQPELTPSAIMLKGIREHGGLIPFTLFLSAQHKKNLMGAALDEAAQSRFNDAARRSLDAQAQIEASPQIPFEEYVAQYFS